MIYVVVILLKTNEIGGDKMKSSHINLLIRYISLLSVVSVGVFLSSCNMIDEQGNTNTPIVTQTRVEAPPIKLKVHTVTPDKLYWISGGVANSGVVIGDTGVIVIDAKVNAEAGRALVTEVAKLTDKPITHVILTHSDTDHVNGLVGFPDNVKIIAHRNTKLEMLQLLMLSPAEPNAVRCLPPIERLPDSVIWENELETTINGVVFDFHFFGPAHTTGDLVVHIPSEKVAFVGDLITRSVLIHPEKNGSFEGWFKAADGLLSLPANKYLGGHADDFDTKESLKKRINRYASMRDKINVMNDQGKTLDEIKLAVGEPLHGRVGCRGIPRMSVSEIQLMEREMKKQRFE